MRFHPGKLSIFLVVVLFSILPCFYCRLLPASIETCTRRDPQLSKCLTKEANRIVKTFTKGYPELGIVSTDPLEMGEFHVFPEGNILQLSQQKGFLKGLKNAKIPRIEFNLKNKTGLLEVLANITLEAKYEVSGQLLIFPITGKGDSIIKQKNLNLQLKFNWKTFIGKDDIEYLRLTNHTFEVTREHTTFKLTGLFGGNKVLGDTMQGVINANANDLMNELGRPAIAAIVQGIIEIINKFFSKIPYSELLPDV